MQLIPIAPTPAKPAADQIAESEIARINAMLSSRIADHRERFLAFWENPSSTPDAILAALGPAAPAWLAAATESIEHLARLAALGGQSLSDVLAPEYYVPRRAFLIAPDGTISLAPAPPAPALPIDPLPDPAPAPPAN